MVVKGGKVSAFLMRTTDGRTCLWSISLPIREAIVTFSGAACRNWPRALSLVPWAAGWVHGGR